jgi:hypothetical protein
MASPILPDGTTFDIAASYGSTKAMSAVTNANPGIATLEASHGVAANDIFEVTSGWPRLNGRVVKAGTPSTNDIPLTGISTVDTNAYPAGSGSGSIREILTWQRLQWVYNVQTQGGDQGFATHSPMESFDEYQLPTSRSPVSLSFEVGDVPGLPHIPLMEAADIARTNVALRANLPNGGIIYYNGILTFAQTPTLNKGNVMVRRATFSLQGLTTRY